MPVVAWRERRRRNVVTAPPDLRLRLAVLRGGLGLVQSLQGAVVPLVQPPAPFDRNPELIQLVERDPTRANRALEDRCVGDVEDVAAVAQQLAGCQRFLAALLAQVDVSPAGEAVFLVPGAFAVAKQDKSIHGAGSWRFRVQGSGFSPSTIGGPPHGRQTLPPDPAPLQFAATGCTSPSDPIGSPSPS